MCIRDRSSSKYRGFWLDPRTWSVSNEKMNTPNVDDCAVINSTSKSKVFPTWAPLPNPKEMKASLSKVQALKFILQIAASKLRFSKFQLSIFKFYLLSPISARLLPTCWTSSFRKLVEEVQNYIKEYRLILKKWVWRVDFERSFWFEKTVLLRKMG